MTKQRQLWLKIGTIALLILILQIPLIWVDSVMKERQHYQYQVSSEISNSWSGQQTITGPFLVVPYSQVYTEKYWDSNLEKYVQVEKTKDLRTILVPTFNFVNGEVDVEKRYRGIYSAPVYRSNIDISGTISTTPLNTIMAEPSFKELGDPYLVTFVSDLRGVSDIPVVHYNDREAQFVEGSKISSEFSGLHSVLDISGLSSIDYQFSLKMKGSNTLSFYPVGKSNKVDLKSSWPHPKFKGLFLPDFHDIADDGFSVQWRLNSLSSNLNELINSCNTGNCKKLVDSNFGVDFIEPVSSYSLSDRASKYATLFLVLTFAAFFLFEVFKALSIHPLQYLMVGLSLSVFYLLLISMSEHVSFSSAYWISAVACIGLIGVYTSHILGGKFRALVLVAALLLIYTLMFFILHSEDYALVMGSILLFSILALVMLATRKLDWYQMEEKVVSSV